MSRRLRLLGVSAIVAGVAGAAIPATASAVPVITMSGSTSVAPLAVAARQGLPQAVSGPGEVQARPGRLGRRRRRRRRRPRHDRQLLARSEGSAIRAAWSSTRSPRTRSASSPTRPTRSRTCRRRRSRRSSPARSATGSDVPGAGTTGTINLVVRTAASGTQDAFQKIFMGSKTVLSGASAEGLQRPRPADRADRQERDRLRVAGLRQGHQRRRLPGRRLQPGATPSPASTAACATSGWSPAGTRARPARCRSSSTGSQNSSRGPEDRRRRTGCRSSRCSSGSESRGRTGAPSGRSARWRCCVLLLIVADDRLRRRPGVAVVPAQRPVVVHGQGRRRRADRQPGQHRRATRPRPTTSSARGR